jgi:hypothetical protein
MASRWSSIAVAFAWVALASGAVAQPELTDDNWFAWSRPRSEGCESPPVLVCPVGKDSVYHTRILCQRLTDKGYTDENGCAAFIASRTCPELLDLQVHARGAYRGTCYGSVLHNCCAEPVRVDISYAPLSPDDPNLRSLLIVGVGDQNLPRGGAAHREELVVKPDGQLGVFWIDTNDKIRAPGANLNWEVHTVRGADAAP